MNDPVPGSPSEDTKGPFRKLLFPFLAALAGLAILLNLGFWQLNRLAWKSDLIARVEAGLSSDPAPLPSHPGWSALGETDDYKRVSLIGEFQDGAAFYYTALTEPKGPASGPGYLVYAPFVAESGWTVLVNRGFIPLDMPNDRRQKALAPPQGRLPLTGILRLSERPNWTTPAADETGRIWFARDTDHMGDVLGVEADVLAPYSVDLEAAFTPEGGFPQAGETIVRFKNDHLGYALTWFGLAATLVGVFLTYAAGVLRPRKD